MRAVVLRNYPISKEEIILNDDRFHHLRNVLRINVNDSILLLDGKGNSRKAQVIHIDKKELLLRTNGEIKYNEFSNNNTIALGLVKKDSFELAIKMCVELAYRKIILIKTEYSQNYPIKEDRLNKIIETAMEQSNNPYYPKVDYLNFSELNLEDYEGIVLASMNTSDTKSIKNKDNLILIGPEGGFSSKEEEVILAHRNCAQLHFDTGILRTPTAIAAISGSILANINN
jgi:16S rRNA (uracil1498-N3)-methyltransferase